MTTKLRTAAQVAEARILELTAAFASASPSTSNNTAATAPTMAPNNPNVKTVRVPHLGGISAAYQQHPSTPDPSLPTLVMVNSFTTSSELYRSQFANKGLTSRMNLLAIELLGHGDTRVESAGSFAGGENWTYWDTAVMNLQVLEALGVQGKVFVLGTSQGGWICVRMALLAPERIAGIIPLGTSVDYESERSRKLGCWDGPAGLEPSIAGWTTASPTPDFEPTDEYCDFLISNGFGADTPQDVRTFWTETIKANYRGDDGRRRIRMAAINLSQRDGLYARLTDVRCPVLWMHGTEDVVYSVPNAREEIEMFVNAASKELRVVEGGRHFLSFSHPEVVDEAVVEFVERYGK